MLNRKKTIKGVPAGQYWREIRRKSVLKSIEKNKGKVRKAPIKKKIKVRERNIPLENYFAYWLENSWYVCENCQALIDPADLFDCQAHILPKRRAMFPSVAGVLENHMTLGVRCGCHHRYDSAWDNASAMPVFKLAKERFLLFKDQIAPEERHRIPDVFLT